MNFYSQGSACTLDASQKDNVCALTAQSINNSHDNVNDNNYCNLTMINVDLRVANSNGK